MSESQPPQIDDAPGLVWKPRKVGHAATWQARSDLIAEGYVPQTVKLWTGDNLTEVESAHIATQCRRLQSDMLSWSRQGGYTSNPPVVTLKHLIDKYQTDPSSTHHKKRYHVRQSQNITLRRISEGYGHTPLNEIKAKTVIMWHAEWLDGVKIAMAHSLVGQLRTLVGFGATMLEDPECERLCAVLHRLRFQTPDARTESLTLEQAMAVCKTAREHFGWESIAFAQALQFDLMLRQKDVIGEWVPVSEPGISDLVCAKGKWLRGLKWSEIDDNMILTHTTSKKGKQLVVDLKMAPLVLRELELGICTRTTKGPLVICDVTGLPWSASEFRRKWRKVATKAGVPKEVRNMDSRSGAISEATDAGIDLEHIRHAATHSNISMTQRYSRGSDKKVANVQKLRMEHRNKPKT